jgi:hypothetical protein
MIWEFIPDNLPEALELLPAIALDFIERIMTRQLKVTSTQPFDPAIVGESLGLAIASTVRLALPKTDSLIRCAYEIERCFLSLNTPVELCEQLAKADGAFISQALEDASAIFMFATDFSTRVFSLTCLVMQFSGTLALLLSTDKQSAVQYSARNREWLRHVVWRLYGSQDTACKAIFCEQWRLVQAIEQQVATLLDAKEHQSFDIRSSVICLKGFLDHYAADEENAANPGDVYGSITGVQDIAQCPSRSSVSSSLLKVAVWIADRLMVGFT